MESHYAIMHLGEEGVTCPYCGYTFTIDYDLRQHEERCEPRSPKARIRYLQRHHAFSVREEEEEESSEEALAQLVEERKVMTTTKKKKTKIMTGTVDLTGEDDEEDEEEEGRGKRPSKRGELIRMFNGEPLYERDLQTVRDPFGWTTDRVMNCYFYLLQMHAKTKKSESGSSSTVTLIAMDSYLYPALLSPKARVSESIIKRARDSVPLTKDWILFPLHLKWMDHWAFVFIDTTSKIIYYADSLGLHGGLALRTILKFIRRMIAEDFGDGGGGAEDDDGWQMMNMNDVPAQNNGCDCGIFTCWMARELCEFIMREEGEEGAEDSSLAFTFTQQDIPGIRAHMLRELKAGEILPV
jgi:Ulp1 family protease